MSRLSHLFLFLSRNLLFKEENGQLESFICQRDKSEFSIDSKSNRRNKCYIPGRFLWVAQMYEKAG